MAVRKRTECAEEQQHKARRLAESEVGMWLFSYADEHRLSDLDMLAILASASQAFLRYANRADEERRTGFRHRLAGE